MLFGKQQGIPLALALVTALGIGLATARSARADGLPIYQHTIPREVDAYDFRTGKPYMAPAVPNGHYAKDYVGEFHKCLGCVSCQLHGLMGGHGCGHGAGCAHHAFGHGGGFGQDGGSGEGAGFGYGTGVVGDGGWGNGAAGTISTGSGIGRVVGDGQSGYPGGASWGILGGSHGIGMDPAGYATTSSQAVAAPTNQSFCGQPGCTVGGKHSHLSSMSNKIRCASCGGMGGCDACAGTGVTGLCGDPGCSLGPGHSHGNGLGDGHGTGTGCSLCGGKGCLHCLSGLGSGLHGKLASVAGLFNRPKISWFNGAGGPVPLTPGYVPYIVTTRSPRDFFSFPPMNPNDP